MTAARSKGAIVRQAIKLQKGSKTGDENGSVPTLYLSCGFRDPTINGDLHPETTTLAFKGFGEVAGAVPRPRTDWQVSSL